MANLGDFGSHVADAAQAWDSYDQTNIPPTNIPELNNLTSIIGIALGMSKDPFLAGMGFQASILGLATGAVQLAEEISNGQYEEYHPVYSEPDALLILPLPSISASFLSS